MIANEDGDSPLGATLPPGGAMGREDGLALLVVMTAMSLLLMLSGSLMVLATVDLQIAATFRDGAAAIHAAETAISRAFQDLGGVADLTAVLDGRHHSDYFDGASGTRTLPDGAALDLSVATNMERCGERVCTDRQMDAATAARPWGVNNPRWQVYASGWLSGLTGAGTGGDFYVIVWVGDDPLENDARPLEDGADSAFGRGVVLLRAAAWGPRGVRRSVEATATRTDTMVQIRSWRELR